MLEKSSWGSTPWAVSYTHLDVYKRQAYNFVRSLGEKGETILFVGTKKQAQEAIKEEAGRVGMNLSLIHISKQYS